MIQVHVDESFAGQGYETLLQYAAHTTLQHEGDPEEQTLTVVLTDDAQLHHLNKQYRDINAPTDVLSFPNKEKDPDSDKQYLGDVVISFERTLAQAQAGGHPPEDEAQLLAVHGTLHLLGHDHDEEADKTKMWSVQDAILSELGVSARPTE
ncbi:MAG: rRNA maturation RNase YbeY [Chloroflexi bacterium]|nr:MAG: rRNA maturation RNase YbeY [Chloroflexota bacterium]MBL1197235.1 rRNA maturation RNase YbeY [Chloroflexota bacterium]NOH14528.1 rRNA maturation RNase YbeY [Chloroflexota bacterium]